MRINKELIKKHTHKNSTLLSIKRDIFKFNSIKVHFIGEVSIIIIVVIFVPFTFLTIMIIMIIATTIWKSNTSWVQMEIGYKILPVIIYYT